MHPYQDWYTDDHSSIFIIVPNWKELKCPLTGNWINKMWIYPHNGTLLSNKKGPTMIHSTAWMNSKTAC